VGGSSGGNSATSGGDLPAIQGTEFMVVADYNTSSGANATHFKISLNPFAIESQVSSTDAFPKVSITDDGTTAVFVEEDNNLYLADLTASTPNTNLTALTTSSYWRKVAISRDGAFIAALTTANDNELFIFKPDGSSQQFTLVNPSTSSDGSIGGAPDYADAIQFTHSGEYIMYDARNTINSTGNPVIVWDIGLIKVRNLNDDSFGDGTIVKPFPPQATNISIGNPSFANNSPYIICYDFLDANTGGEFVAAANLETGENNVIVETNGVIGYPTYSPQDNQIAFSDFNSTDQEYLVNVIDVQNDKITATGSAQNMLVDAAWPVWYTQGTRAWQTPTAEFTSNVVQGPAKLTVNFEDASTNSPTQWSWTFEDGNPATSDQTNPVITFDNPGMYQVSLTVSNPSGSDSETKTNYITVGEPAAIEDIDAHAYHLSASPNPAIGLTTIELNVPRNEIVNLNLYDMHGKLIKNLIQNQNVFGYQSIVLNVHDLAKGTYLLEMLSENKKITFPLLVQ